LKETWRTNLIKNTWYKHLTPSQNIPNLIDCHKLTKKRSSRTEVYTSCESFEAEMTHKLKLTE